MKLESYLGGRWQAGAGAGRALVNPVSGAEIARADATGIDLAAALAHARDHGGPALRAMGFAARGEVLKAIADVLQANRADYAVIARENSGNTAADAAVDIDGGIFTLRTYARLAKSLGDAAAIMEPDQDQLARDPVFFARHVWTTRPGVAVQINAFNFPSWGMWEKVAQALLAGVPSLAKPATSTALLSERMMRDVIAAGVAPEGALSILCGGADGLVEALGPMDSVAFTGSAATGRILRRQLAEVDAAPRLTIEADSVNATIIGPDVVPASELFDLALREAAKALTIKAGQLCTNIRRIFVPREIAGDFDAALSELVEALVVGDPAAAETQVGPLINAAQRDEALKNIEMLRSEARLVAQARLPGSTDPQSGFVAPTLLRCDDPDAARNVHAVEVFGPCATIMPYDDFAGAARLAARGEGSLALSLFSDDTEVQRDAIATLGPWHGRILMVDSEVGRSHTGHSIVMPHCVHGGPGRAGGGEELGGLRGMRFHLQRTAVQGGPSALARLAGAAAERVL